MSVPASKKSNSAAKRRRSHIHVDPVNLGNCEKCKKPVRPHHACNSCGFYKGRDAIAQVAPKTHAHTHAAEETKTDA
ncbi:50S ribosomal protein L32 [Candidatus Uhrbacteria bacterium]|jgi:large subunit ribosomal protein L32|nr:50S ribosomal protein L32 [Candidatus Uhrbacteria bacterium]